MGRSKHEEILGEVNPGFNLWTSAHGFHHLSLTNRKGTNNSIGQLIITAIFQLPNIYKSPRRLPNYFFCRMANWMGFNFVDRGIRFDCNSCLLFCLRFFNRNLLKSYC